MFTVKNSGGASCSRALRFVRACRSPPPRRCSAARPCEPSPRTVVVATAPHAHSTMEAPQEAEVDFSEVFSVDKIAYNAKALNYCRVFVAIIAGMAAGVMGLTSLVGAAAFLLTTMLLSVGFYLKVGGEPKPFFKKGDSLWTMGVSEAAMVRASAARRRGAEPPERRERTAAAAGARRRRRTTRK